MNIVIKHRNGTTLYEGEAPSLRAAVEKCVRELGLSLTRANLMGANLMGAILAGADLAGADLAGANLVGADLAGANLVGADLAGADLAGATLVGADLAYANLAGADLAGANLVGADLAGADLVGANLMGANLMGAHLAGATGINPYLTTPLHLLREQPGAIRAYKLVTANGVGPFNGGITYVVGESYEVGNADGDERQSCGRGIHLATLDWCLRSWRLGYRILVAEFMAADIVAIPLGSNGKFRVHRCRIVGEKDLAALGWPPSEAMKATEGHDG